VWWRCWVPEVLGDIGVGLWAQLACLVAAVSYAIAGVWGRRLAHLPAVTVAAGQLIAATVLLAPLAMLVDRPWRLAMPSPAALGALLALAVLSTALAYVIYFRILARAGATNLLLVTFLIPVSAILLGTAVLGERLAPHHFVGMAIIAVGLAAIDGRPARSLAWAMRTKRAAK
jgi:drug/metabolite transporter (DMT)-like permease